MFEIRRYTPDCSDAWNRFVAQSKNGTFLFHRDYMDYHQDRFHDCSLMFYREGCLFGVMPANEEGNTFCTHRGLTYGGLVMDTNTTSARVCQLFRELNDWLRQEGFRHVVYKPVPHIYHTVPAEEDSYALFSVCEARLIDRSLSTSVELERPLSWYRDRKYGVNRSRNAGVIVEESSDFSAFWEVLRTNLSEKYGATPVHSLQEMELLHARFPENIRLFVARRDGELLGGTVLYITKTVVHTQYISASKVGKQLRVMDAVFDELLRQRKWGARYFDFGTSNEEDGHVLVEPLIYQKEGFGARGVCYDWYEWEL